MFAPHYNDNKHYLIYRTIEDDLSALKEFQQDTDKTTYKTIEIPSSSIEHCVQLGNFLIFSDDQGNETKLFWDGINEYSPKIDTSFKKINVGTTMVDMTSDLQDYFDSYNQKLSATATISCHAPSSNSISGISSWWSLEWRGIPALSFDIKSNMQSFITIQNQPSDGWFFEKLTRDRINVEVSVNMNIQNDTHDALLERSYIRWYLLKEGTAVPTDDNNPYVTAPNYQLTWYWVQNWSDNPSDTTEAIAPFTLTEPGKYRLVLIFHTTAVDNGNRNSSGNATPLVFGGNHFFTLKFSIDV